MAQILPAVARLPRIPDDVSGLPGLYALSRPHRTEPAEQTGGTWET